MEMKYNHDIQFDLDHLSAYEHVTDLNEKKAELDAVYKQHREPSDNRFTTQFMHFFKLESKRQLDALPGESYLKIEPADGLPYERVNRIAELAFEALLEDFATTDAYLTSESLDDMIHWAVSMTIDTEIH